MLIRIFFAFTFLSQILRFPLAFLLASDANLLNDYFLLVSLCIPIHFFSNEVVLYKGLNFKEIQKNDIFVLCFWIFVVIYIYFNHEHLLIPYILTTIALLSYNVLQFCNRDVFGAISFIIFELILNLLITFIVLLLCVYLKNDLSEILIVTISFLYLSVSLMIYFRFQINKSDINFKVKGKKENFDDNYFAQIKLMIITQLERLIISQIYPLAISFIVLVSTFVEAMRRLIYDDSLLFLDFKRAKRFLFAKIINDKLKLYTLGFVAFFSLSIPVFLVVKKYSLWSYFLNSYDEFLYVYYIFLIYIIAMPSGIISVNLLRANLFPASHLIHSILNVYITLYVLTLFCLSIMDILIQTNLFFVFLLSSTFLNSILYMCISKYYNSYSNYLIIHLFLISLNSFFLFWYIDV